MNLNLFTKPARESTNQKIFRAALIVGVLALAAKAASTLKELIIARSFGRGDEVDSFLIAFVLPTFILNIGMSSIGYALVPIFVETRNQEGDEAGSRLLSSILLLSTMVLTGIAALLGLLAPIYLPLLGANFSPAKLELTRELLYLLLPWIIFSGVAALAAAVSNANEKFALPALAPLITSFSTMLFVVLAAWRFGVFTLVAGTVVGSFLEAAILLRTLQTQGLWLRFHWYGMDRRVRGVLTQYLPMLTGSILMGSTTVVDQVMAAMLSPGSVAALGFANKIVAGALSLAGMAISTATLPYFARMAASRDWAGCRHTLKRYSMLVLVLTVPFTLLMVTFSKPIIMLLYQHGAFTAADTLLVSRVQVCYAIQIPFYICSLLFIRFISAIGHNIVLMYASAINLALDLGLNLVLMRRFQVAGIALSTSIVHLISFLMVSIWSIRFLSQERQYASADARAESAH